MTAHRGNVRLVEEELGAMSPAIAVLGPPRREREDVIGGIANGMQDRAVFDREGLSQLFWRGTQEATSPEK